MKLLFKLPVLLIPAVFAYFGFIYSDNLYFGISIILLFVSLLIIFPAFLSKRSIELPKIKVMSFDIKRMVRNKRGEKSNTLDLFGLELKVAMVLVILNTALFSYISIFILKSTVSNNNIFFSYFLNQYYFLLTIKEFVIVTLLAIVVILLIILNKDKKINSKELIKKGLVSLGITLVTFIAGLSLALASSLVTATLQLNYSSASLMVNSQNSGVITDQKKIIDKLKSMDKTPVIIPYTSSEKNKLLETLINPNSNDKNFYLKVVVSSIPSSLILPLQVPNKSVFMVNDVLVVKSINPSDIEPISPYIGYLLVKNYFDSRFIKSYPSVKVMGRQEYLDYRVSQYNQSISKLNSSIQALKNEISNDYGSIQDYKNKIASWQSYIQTANSYKSSAYSSCISAGYYDYFTGNFISTYSQSYCQSLASSEYDGYINQANQNISTLNQDINIVNGYISQDQDYKNILESYVSSLEAAKTQTPQELGVFEANDNIKVAVDETSPNVIVDYFEALSHEYLHYASYVNKDQALKYSFFEEGLTETFARQIIKKEFGINTHIGYPVLVAIMTQIIQKIPSKTLEEIYFAKDESSLEAVLTNAYGEKFYSDFRNYFDIIGYLPARESLSMANAILLRMGSKTINESDLYSSSDTSN